MLKYYPIHINEDIRLFLIKEASKNLISNPRICSLCLSIIIRYPFRITDFDQNVIKKAIFILQQKGSKYKSLIDFLLQLTVTTKKAIINNANEYLIQSFLFNDDYLFKFCMAQIEFGTIPSLNFLIELISLLGDVNELAFNLKENIILLFGNVLTKTDENVSNWIWENLEIIEDIINIDELKEGNTMHLMIALKYDIAYKIHANDFSYLHQSILDAFDD